MIWDHCEDSNEKSEVSRNGGDAQLTNRTDKLHAVNSVAISCGFIGDELPVKERLDVPLSISQLKEYLLEWSVNCQARSPL